MISVPRSFLNWTNMVKFSLRSLFGMILLAVQPLTVMAAEPVPFDGSWKEQGFLRLFSNDYIQRGAQVDIVSDGTVSLLWRPVDATYRDTTRATWTWSVSEGVIPTDLRTKGGDDRNLAVYFIFVDPARADALDGKSARRILSEDSARAIIYVWGGEHPAGARLASPYSPRMGTQILQTATTGRFAESVNLAQDYRSLFGSEPGALIGMALSADSDDTDGRIVASVSNLALN